MRLLFVGAGLAALLAAPSAFAENYVALGVNLSESQQGPLQFDEGLGYSAAIGHDFGALRAEASYTKASGEALGGIIQGDADIFGATLYADLLHLGSLTLSPGIGADYVNGEATFNGVEIGELDGGDWHLAGQATLALNERVSLVGSYTDYQDSDIQSVGLGVRVAL